MNFGPLQTKRLILREFMESDLPGILEYSQDPEVFRYLESGPFSENETKAQLQAMMACQKENPHINYELAVILKETSRIIGNGGIHISSPTNREGWVDFALNRRYWSQGYATEIASVLLEFGFTGLRLHRIMASCTSTNQVSERIMVKVGMKREGYFRDHKLIRDQWQDALMYAILEEEWTSNMKR